jgi:hypothetical protein
MWARQHLRPFPQIPELEAPRRGMPDATRPPLRVRLATWLRRPRLDAALADGADPAGSPLLAHRAAILVSRGNRNRLAGALRSGRESAARGPVPFSAAVAVDAPAVVAVTPQLEELEALLRSPQPVYCPGMARAWHLVTDGCGPLYAPQSPAQLRDELDAVLAALHGDS